MKINALWHENANTSLIKSEQINYQKSDDYLLLHSSYSMISSGTERSIAKQTISSDFFDKMKVPYMKGNFNLPIKYGYSLIGHYDKKQYHVMHPHQDKIIVKKQDVFEIDNNIPPYRASLLSNMETILNAIWDAEITEEDTIGIIGFGNIGSLLAMTIRLRYSIDCHIIEKNTWRINKSKELGWSANDELGNQKYDIIFNTSASSIALQNALKSLKFEGKVIELSWYGNETINLNLGHHFHYNRLSIISSQVSTIPKKIAKEVDYFKRKKLAEQLLLNEEYDKLITDIVDFEYSPILFQNLRDKTKSNFLIQLIKYPNVFS